MPRRRKDENLVKVRVTGPNCKYGERVIMPGETAIIPAELAQEWNQTGRAVIVTVEVINGDRQNSQ